MDKIQLEESWDSLMLNLERVLNKRPKDLNAVLYLIGVQELGKGFLNFSKEEKQDLIHIAICRLFSKNGYYAFEGLDQDGWPHWTLIQKLPFLNILDQEKLLKEYILEYFEEEQVF